MSILDLLVTEEEQRARSNRVNGVAIGIVTDNKDPENMGRVKLKFPWLSEQDVTDWVRIATLMAGKERGSYFLPEVGDEVLVAFDHGDISHPYVIGVLWNKADAPPENNSDGENNIRQICSRSGHKVTFDDTTSKEKIEIITKAGHNIVLDDSAGQEKLEIVDKSGSNFIKIDSIQNSISIESGMKLSIKAPMIEIESSGMMKIKAGAILTIEGAMVKIN
jgi:uncharacterized protein involved in type VI secretion and phage assembly